MRSPPSPTDGIPDEHRSRLQHRHHTRHPSRQPTRHHTRHPTRDSCYMVGHLRELHDDRQLRFLAELSKRLR
eukprot:gene9181-biopygen6421